MENKFSYSLKTLFIATIILLPYPSYGYVGQGATGATRALYHFCKKSGTTAGDSSGYGNNGTFLAIGEPAWNSNGRFGYALQFDGTNDYVAVSDATSLDITNAITIEAWVKPSADGWKYKRPITLSPATSQANYQIKVELTTSNFDYSKAKTNGEDLRFYETNGTSLDYWIEEWNATGNSTIWVEVATSGESTIYMYYGNSSASSASSGTATFEFFDDLETWSGWTTHSGGQVSQDNTRQYEGTYSAHKTTNNDPNGAYKDIGQTLGRDIVLEFWLNRNSGYSGGAADRVGIIDNNGNGYGWIYIHSSDVIGKDKRTNYSGAYTSTSATDYMDTWVKGQFIIKSNNEIISNRYVSGALDGQHTSSDVSYSSFTRVYIFGGHDYWVERK